MDTELNSLTDDNDDSDKLRNEYAAIENKTKKVPKLKYEIT